MPWFFDPEFSPRFKPKEFVMIRGEFYEVVETRPMLPFEYKLTNITSELNIDLKDAGLKGLENELLNYRLKMFGPVKVVIRIEGVGGPIYGGWGALEKVADERTPENALEFLQLGDKVGYLVVRVAPITSPAWLKLKAYGWVYIVRKAERVPETYAVPPFIAYPLTPR
jgi:hypothetical protein